VGGSLRDHRPTHGPLPKCCRLVGLPARRTCCSYRRAARNRTPSLCTCRSAAASLLVAPLPSRASRRRCLRSSAASGPHACQQPAGGHALVKLLLLLLQAPPAMRVVLLRSQPALLLSAAAE